MNIPAINASSTLTPPKMPRKAVSFTGTAETVTAAASETAKTAKPSIFKRVFDGAKTIIGKIGAFFKGIFAHFKKGGAKAAESVAESAGAAAESAAKKPFVQKAGDLFKKAGSSIKKGFTKGKDAAAKFIAEHKGAKGVKLAAIGLTVVVAGGFAIKELHDIITKSNPEK